MLHRLVPPKRGISALPALLRQSRLEKLDGIAVHYVRYISPPRGRSYARWGAWAAPMLGRALSREGPFDVVHAHNAVPAGDAVLRTGIGLPLVVSVHGGDVLWTNSRVPGGREAVEHVLRSARLVLANSSGIERLVCEHGARAVRVVHLGTDLPPLATARARTPVIGTVAALRGEKNLARLLQAFALLRQPAGLVIVGDGPERDALERRCAQLGVAGRVEFAGQLDHASALRRAREAWCFVMVSTEEAFGVAYIEAMAAGVPAVGCAGEPGPQEIAAAGGGIVLVPPRSPAALAQCLRGLLTDDIRREQLGATARATVEAEFTWERCGARTLSAYEEALS